MPRVKQTDPRETAVRSRIGSIMGVLQTNIPGLARITGMDERTLRNRIGNKGDVSQMRLYELWAIEDAGKKKGWKE